MHLIQGSWTKKKLSIEILILMLLGERKYKKSGKRDIDKKVFSTAVQYTLHNGQSVSPFLTDSLPVIAKRTVIETEKSLASVSVTFTVKKDSPVHI